jgi:glyceraldehyde-3-phosphate dehydrogenase/erythrose-4-phosphate dehydrogenase
VLLTERETSVSEMNSVFNEEASSERYKHILGVSDEPIVSSDVIGQSYASIVDLTMTQVVDGDLVKIMSWYDNEWVTRARWYAKLQLLAGDLRFLLRRYRYCGGLVCCWLFTYPRCSSRSRSR